MHSRFLPVALLVCIALVNAPESLALNEFNTDRLTISRNEILSGGPGKDGIPALTDPRMVSVRDARDVADSERVVVVRLRGETRAYPFSILVDEFGEERLVLEAGRVGRIAVREQPSGAQVVHTFWFAWAALQAETDIYVREK